MSKPKIRIVSVGVGSPVLEEVKRLWRANSRTLGLFPDGAFADRAARGQILAAIDAGDHCIGYLTYHTGKQKANINHLCVEASHKRRGIASLLIRELTERTRESCRGISLSCRSDFPVNQVWPRLGFVAQRERQGRSADGHLLTFWWLDHEHPDLFSSLSASEDNRTNVVIDANVFFDLNDNSREGSEESQGLWADWIQPHVQLCIDDELYNEIARHPDAATRRERRKFAYRFTPVTCGTAAFLAAQDKVKKLLPDWTSEGDAADVRHLARTIPSSATVFLTRDQRLLDESDRVYERFGLSIIRPSEFIGRIDELVREDAYQSSQLAGTQLCVIPVRADLTELASRFHAGANQERKTKLEKRLRFYVASPRKFTGHIVSGKSGVPLALMVTECEEGQPTRIPTFRLTPTRLTGTLARTLLRSQIQRAISENRPAITVEEEYVSHALAEALADLGFIPLHSCWIKVCLGTATTCVETATILRQRVAELGIIRTSLDKLDAALNSDIIRATHGSASEIEHLLWPAKLTDCELPTYIIAIDPEWAQHLFDERLAEQTLFGADIELALNPESVYYRRRRPSGLTSPGRILWYVKDAKRRFSGTKCLRACSRIDEVVNGKPKDLFRRFRRLGVYEWRHVFETAKNDINTEIQAVRFSDTEVFGNPMEWDRLQGILRARGVRSTFQSPRRIPREVFVEIYRECTGL